MRRKGLGAKGLTETRILTFCLGVRSACLITATTQRSSSSLRWAGMPKEASSEPRDWLGSDTADWLGLREVRSAAR